MLLVEKIEVGFSLKRQRDMSKPGASLRLPVGGAKLVSALWGNAQLGRVAHKRAMIVLATGPLPARRTKAAPREEGG
jgi:hypothetical protein